MTNDLNSAGWSEGSVKMAPFFCCQFGVTVVSLHGQSAQSGKKESAQSSGYKESLELRGV